MKAEEKAREYNRMRRAWLKEHGICIECAQRDAFNNRVRCEYCLEKAYKYREPTDARRAYMREYRKKRKEQGICQNCGKRVYAGSKTYCEICHSRYKAHQREAKRKKLEALKSEERTERNKEIFRKNIAIARSSPKWLNYLAGLKKRLFKFSMMLRAKKNERKRVQGLCERDKAINK